MPKAKITALGCYTPPRVLTNFELEKMVQTSNQWILDRTGISERHIAGPEVATSDLAVCAGFLYGLTTGAHLVSAGTHGKVLVIGADTMSRIIDYTDRSTCVLFGDGAGAMLIEPTEEDEGFIGFLNEI